MKLIHIVSALALACVGCTANRHGVKAATAPRSNKAPASTDANSSKWPTEAWSERAAALQALAGPRHRWTTPYPPFITAETRLRRPLPAEDTTSSTMAHDPWLSMRRHA